MAMTSKATNRMVRLIPVENWGERERDRETEGEVEGKVGNVKICR